MNKQFQLLLLFLLTTLLSCQGDLSGDSTSNQGDFFDLKNFFKTEFQQLADKHKVEKTTRINGVEETKQFDKINFEEELAVFLNSDINKISWLDKYQVDSVFNTQNLLTEIRYTAIDEKLRTKKMVITYAEDAVNSIYIRNASKNIITDAEQILDYSPKTGYQISSRQKVIFSPEKNLAVTVKF